MLGRVAGHAGGQDGVAGTHKQDLYAHLHFNMFLGRWDIVCYPYFVICHLHFLACETRHARLVQSDLFKIFVRIADGNLCLDGFLRM